jgi:ABC-type multidrug transport system fused ATPase/permease subunit
MEKELEITTTGSPPDPAGDRIPALHQDHKDAEKPDILVDDITNIDVSEDKDSRASTEEEQQHISFRPVEPVAVSVRGLTITVSAHSTLGKKKKKPNNNDGGEAPPEEKEKKILDAVSADFPAGELTAIIGGSGSGKVCSVPLQTSE